MVLFLQLSLSSCVVKKACIYIYIYMHLNHDKSELICADTATRDAMLPVVPRLRPVDPHDATFGYVHE